MTSLNDVRVVSPHFSEKSIAHVQESLASLPAHLPASPPIIFTTTTEEPSHHFHNLNFKPVTYIYVTVPHRVLAGSHTRLAIYPALAICYQRVVIHALLDTRFEGRR